MADVYKASPLNLTMLSKKRAIESMLDGENIENSIVKRQRREEEVGREDVEEEPEETAQEFEENGDEEKSKTSILKHFYSFIRRKADQQGDDIPPNIDAQKHGQDSETSPTEADKPPTDTFERLRALYNLQTKKNNGHISPTLPDQNMYALEYNAALNRQLAARANTANLMDIWNAMAVNALARAKSNEGSEIPRKSPTFPTLVGVNGNSLNGSEYEQKLGTPNSYTTSPASINAIPERTMRQNNWAVKVWRDWAIERNSHANMSGKTGPLEIVPMDIKDATVDGMSYWLPKFITEVRRRDKRPYPPDTLMQIASGLQRHLRHVSGRSDITFFDKYSPTFAEFREALKARSDAINSEMSTTRRGSEQDSSPEISDMGNGNEPFSSSMFNLNTAKGLFRAIFYYNCLSFHITSMEEHHSLLVSQFQIGVDEQTRQEFLEFTRENGQVTRKIATPYDSRCIVEVFKKYFQHIPSNGLLYKRPLQSSDGTELRFSFNPVGINKLRETFKMLFGGKRSGAHLSSMEDDDEREAMATGIRIHSAEDDSRRTLKFNQSPCSDTSSGQASYLDLKREYAQVNRRPSDASGQEQLSPTRSVISYAAENKVTPIPSPDDTLDKQRPKALEENSNNNASTIDVDDSMTMKLPSYVKSIIIIQGNKRFKVDLTAMN